MKKRNLFIAASYLLALCLFLSACKKETSISGTDDDNPPNSNELVDPTDANALSDVLIIPNAEMENGTPPPPSNASSAPTVSNNVQVLTSSNGSTTPLDLNYENVVGSLGGCYVQVDGADSYFNVPYSGNNTGSGTLNVPVNIPTNVDAGEFCLTYCVYDNSGQVSNLVTTCVTILRLGTGAMQISLTWNTATDQDLWVTEPDGNEISYINTSSGSGGQLDRDDTYGYGPENIYWLDEAPDGSYLVEVHDFDETSNPNTCYVTVNTATDSRQFTVTTQNGSRESVVTIVKNGDNYSFQ